MKRAPELALLVFLLLVAGALLEGCGDSGSRGRGPNATVERWSVYWWPGANATMRLYLRETTQLHVDLLNSHLNGEPLVRGEIVFYQTRADLMQARNTVQSSYGQTPVLVVGPLQFSGVGFLHPFTRAVHVWAGAKLEADQLGHLMLHVVIDDQQQHLDPRWQRFLIEDWLLSLQIGARR